MKASLSCRKLGNARLFATINKPCVRFCTVLHNREDKLTGISFKKHLLRQRIWRLPDILRAERGHDAFSDALPSHRGCGRCQDALMPLVPKHLQPNTEHRTEIPQQVQSLSQVTATSTECLQYMYRPWHREASACMLIALNDSCG